MTTYSTDTYVAKRPPTSEGVAQNTLHMIGTAQLPASLATNDVINAFSLPVNAVVIGVTLQAASQLDSNGSPTLTFDVGISGTPQLFVAATNAVGRAAGVTGVSGVATAGTLYKNTTGKDLPIIVTVHAGPATGVAGALTLLLSYMVQEATASYP